MKLPNAAIFRAYDIRGIVGESLTAEDFLYVGQSFASHVADKGQCRTPMIVAMRDARASSPNLSEAMIDGMKKAGAHVLDGGVGPTPMCYFATHHLNADGSVMITGSHNPGDHNGAKFMFENLSLSGTALASLRVRCGANDVLHSRGQREEIDMLDEYVLCLKTALGESDALNRLSFAWDAGNGVAGIVLKELLADTALPQKEMYFEPDSAFPNHHPDPAEPENMHALQQAIKADATLAAGFAFDGDGDRLGVVDDKGRLVAPDHLLMLLADDVLKRKPGSTIIADVKTSDLFFARVKADGGAPLMWKTGHALIKEKMKETRACFAGEASGHIFFADEYFGYDDGLYAALRVARIIAESGKKLSELIDELPKLHASAEMRIDCPDERKFALIEELATELKEVGADVNTLDGVRVSTGDGWWLLRASNTQAKLVLRAEGNSREATERLITVLRNKLSAKGVKI